MSEQDNFENLSNAEIRAKCIQYGLPNIPVTESSRKILIKKLRISIGGEGGAGSGSNLPAAAATASPKKQTRRETISAAVKQVADVKLSDSNTTNNLDTKDNPQRNKGRRPSENIASAKESPMQTANAPTNNDKVEIRGVKVNLAKSSGTPTKVEEKKPLRRKSVQPEEIGSQRSNVSRIPQRREPIAEDEETTKTTTSLQKPIEDRRKSVEKSLPLTQRNAANPSMPLIKENVLLSNSLIVLESDEEEDAQLARAARNVEDNMQKRNVNQQKLQQQAQAQIPKQQQPQIQKQQQPQIQKQQQPQIQKQQQPQNPKQQQPQNPKQQVPVVIGATSAASAQHNSEFYQNAFYGSSSVTKESSKAAHQMPITSVGTGLAKETETPIASIGTKSTLYGSGLSQVPSTSSGISSSNLYATISDRYTIGSYNSPMQQRFSTLATGGISMASSPYVVDNQKRPPTLVTANEFSDDPGPESDEVSSPYLSKFARDLERLKGTPITERSSFRAGAPRNRRTVAAIRGSRDPEVRPPLRTEDLGVSGALMKFLKTLDRKYQLKTIMIILLAIVCIIITYVLFF